MSFLESHSLSGRAPQPKGASYHLPSSTTLPLKQLVLSSPGRPHSLLAVAIVAEDTLLKTVQGHEADVLKHVEGDHRTLRQAPPFSLEERDIKWAQRPQT